jgi:hypothetical protein
MRLTYSSICLALPLVLAAGGAFAQTEIISPVQTEIIAPSAPPPMRAEPIPPPPGASTMTWEAGYWSWNGGNWVWMAGHYVERPSAQAVWQPGHWLEQSNGWLWVAGRWQITGG